MVVRSLKWLLRAIHIQVGGHCRCQLLDPVGHRQANSRLKARLMTHNQVMAEAQLLREAGTPSVQVR